MYTASKDSSVICWNITTDFLVHNRRPDGSRISRDESDRTKEYVHRFRLVPHGEVVRSIDITKCERMMVASIGGCFHLLDLISNTVLHTFGHVEFEPLNDVVLFSSLRCVPRYAVELTLRGVKLPSRDWMSKSDPYFEILRRRTQEEDKSGVMYRSETYV